MIFRICILFCFIHVALSDYLSIPLVRHKSITEQALNQGLKYTDINWMKPKPKPPGNSTVPLYRYLDSEFYGVVYIGSPAQKFNMVLDTAWGYSWVISEDCSPYNVACIVHNKYDHSKSTSYKENGTKFIINEGTYNLTGVFSIDNFVIENVHVYKQVFAEISELPNIYALEKADGVIGLGYRSLTNGINPVFYNMLQQGNIRKPVFSFYLNRDKSSNKGGYLYLGDIVSRHMAPNHTLMYLPVNRTGYWQFKMDRVVMDDGKKSYGFCLNGCQAVLDTSTNAIVGPTTSILNMNRIIGAKIFKFGKYRISCNAILKLPKLVFTIGGQDFPIKGEDYVQKMSWNFLTVCISAFQAAGNENELWFLGGAFLAEYYSIYNLAENKIGLVKSH